VSDVSLEAKEEAEDIDGRLDHSFID